MDTHPAVAQFFGQQQDGPTPLPRDPPGTRGAMSPWGHGGRAGAGDGVGVGARAPQLALGSVASVPSRGHAGVESHGAGGWGHDAVPAPCPATRCDSREWFLQAAPLGPNHLPQRHERLPQEVLHPEHSTMRPWGLLPQPPTTHTPSSPSQCTHRTRRHPALWPHQVPWTHPMPQEPPTPRGLILHLQDHPRCPLHMLWTHPVPPGPSHSPGPILCPPQSHPMCPESILHPSGHPTPILHPQSHPHGASWPHPAPCPTRHPCGVGAWWAPTFCQSPWGTERWRVG